MIHDVPVLAWVESPLQLVGAAEWADANDRVVPLAGRLSTQMPETADELIARGASFGASEPYLGIPWNLLARHPHWLIGDGFSGQFRLAASVLRPRRITFLDDGANTYAFADVLLGRAAYARPGVDERGLTTKLVPLALHRIHARARAGAVEVFTAFDLGADRLSRLEERGIAVRRHGFDWTRRTAPPLDLPHRRILLGSARPVDGRMPLPDYLAWVRLHAAEAPVTYLPHRREPRAQLAAVAAIDGVALSATSLPAELVLAGATAPLEILTLPSSTTTTIPLVLRGSGSVVTDSVVTDSVSAPSARTSGRDE